jgi:hypothetical protein
MVANSFGNKSCMQRMKGLACTNEGPVLFFLGRWEGIFLFSGVAMPLAQAKNGGKQFWK